jgi:hypothetical protein
MPGPTARMADKRSPPDRRPAGLPEADPPGGTGTREFYRPPEKSPSSQGYHWNNNAETYYLIGTAMGEAMKKLCGK